MDFIYQDFISDLSICDSLIAFFKDSKEYWKPGKCIDGEKHEFKKCTEIHIPLDSNHSLIHAYVAELDKVTKQYIDKFQYSNAYTPWGLTESFNIQYYKPSEAFYGWHCERAVAKAPYCNRHLVWMTYLNDVEHDGGTEFFYQQLKIKPEKGKTVIFPADWTHTHRGVPSKIQDKYIITGWFNYLI